MALRSLLRQASSVLLVTGFVTGCAFLRESVGLGPQKPKVQLSAIDVQKASLAQLELLVTLRVDNPNDFDLNFSKLKYKMVAGDLEIASGTYGDRISVPATNHALIKLPLTVDSGAALKLAQDLLTKKDEVFAVMNATADFETPFGAMEVAFEDKHALKKLAGF